MGKAFNGLYRGAGLARTNIAIEFEMFGFTLEEDENYNTSLVKAGYGIALDPFILDLGIRYDAIDMDEWANQPLTLYAMAIYPWAL